MCQDELLTLRYDQGSHKPMRRRFHEQPGVTVSVLDYGSTRAAPFYEPLYTTLEAAGYVRDRDIRIAGYDSRLTPDMGGFLERTIKLIEQTSRANGNRPVHLVGHSNGPLYAQYLLTHTSKRWRDRYIHGFTPFAGNFPGQGVLYPVVFTGLNNVDFTFPTTPEKGLSAAKMFLTAPSTYMSAADPAVFGTQEVVVTDRSTGKSYTPADWPQLFDDAGLPRGRRDRRLLHRVRGVHRSGVVPQRRRLRREGIGARDGGRAHPCATSASGSWWTARPSSSPAMATSTRRTSPTTPSACGRRCAATISR